MQTPKCQHALPEGLPRRVGHGVGSPSPLVSSAPIWILLSASELSRACASVFAAQNSTPCITTRLISVKHSPHVILGLCGFDCSSSCAMQR